MTSRRMISEREEELPEEELGNLLKISIENKNVISLGPGEPDFLPPKHVLKAMKRAVDNGFTHYSPPQGRAELLEEISRKLKRENNIEMPPENIVVTTGSTEAILLSLMSVVDPGEYVMVPDPCFIAYIPTIELLNGYPLSIPLSESSGFQLDAEELKKLLKEPKRTRAIIINSPSNPTGAVYSKKVLEEVAEVAVDNNVLIISDEAYEKFVYRGKHVSIGSLNGMEDYVLTLQTFSKTYGMAGFRVGYAAGPRKIIKSVTNLKVFSTLCTPTMSQIAAVAALKGSQSDIKKHVKEYDRRRKYIIKRINEIEGFTCTEPQGAFYAFVKFDFKMNSLKLCKWLIENAKVVCIPGSDFGRYGEGYIRFSYATSYDKIVRGMERIEKALKKL